VFASAPPPATLVDGYRIAMEVVAREWRHREGPAGTIQVEDGTTAQRELFANVRENRFVAADESQRMLLGAKELLASPGVAATVLYRMAQSRTVATTLRSMPCGRCGCCAGSSPIANLGGRFPKLGTTEKGADGGVWVPAN